MGTNVPSLALALSLIPDFRQARGRRPELLPALHLACAAVMCGCRSQSALSEWATNYGSKWLRKLGFASSRGPSQSTLHRIFRGINHSLLERALTSRAARVLTLLPADGCEQLEGFGIDGKTLCGSSKQGSSDSHLLSCLSHRLGIVVAQVAVSDKTNEITRVDELLEGLVLTGKVVTGDAMITQRSIAKNITGRAGDYLLVVKDNQPQLLDDIKMSFEPYWWLTDSITSGSLLDSRADRIHQWELKASTLLDGYSDWPGLKQVLKLERVVSKKGSRGVRRETAYAITSSARERARPEQLIKPWRGIGT